MAVKAERHTDPATGETKEVLVEDMTPKRVGKARVRYSSPYAITFLDGLRLLAKDRAITGTMHRVMAALLLSAPLDGEPFRPEPTRMRRLTNMSNQQLANTYTALAHHLLILRTSHGYVALNPTYFWRGPAEARERALDSLVAYEAFSDDDEDYVEDPISDQPDEEVPA